MLERIIHPAKPTAEFMPSVYGNVPAMRAYELPDMVSVNVKDLFPNMPEALYDGVDKNDLSEIVTATRNALADVDMSDIKPDDTINLLTCEHGFLLFGGQPYVEMIKTIRDVVQERTGNFNIRLKLVMYRTPKEGYECIEYYHLDEEFENIESVAAYDKGVPIQTRIGTVYGLESVYNADKIIFCYYDDPREVWCSNYYRKSFKAFTMDMARFETRALFHYGFGQAAGHGPVANIVPTSIYDSDFVQSKWAFACFLRTTPSGVFKITADKDLYKLDDDAITTSVKFFPYMQNLLLSVPDYIMIHDGSRWPHYTHGAGIISGINWSVWQDHYDLDQRVYGIPDKFLNDGLRCVIMNQSWVGLGFSSLFLTPTIMVGQDQWQMWKDDPTNKMFTMSPELRVTDTLPEAVKMAKDIAGTENIVLYDGSFGFINCSRSFAEALYDNAERIRKEVDEELYPKYMAQRDLEIPEWMK